MRRHPTLPGHSGASGRGSWLSYRTVRWRSWPEAPL